MKKIFAILLTLALLLPMGLVPVTNAEGEVTAKPFYTLGWSDFNQNKYPYLDGLYQLNWSNIGGNVKLSGLTYSEDAAAMEEEALALAQTVKKNMDARPAGARYIHTFGPAKMYRLLVENALFFDEATTQMAAVMEAFFKAYKEIGGQLDGLVIDLEYVGLSTYYLIDHPASEFQSNTLIENPDLLRQIVADPRYYTQIRPLLEEWGFVFYQADTPEKQASYTELYSLSKSAGSKYSRSRNVWNTVVRIHLNQTLNIWGYETLKKYFPEANMSDYQSLDTATWLKMSAVTDDGTEMNGGNSVVAGDTSTYSFYYGNPDKDFYESNRKYNGYNEAVFRAEPYSQLMYYVNFGKYMYEASTTKKIAPWITYYDYSTETSYRINSTAYYTEQLYHLGMLDPQPFLNYAYKGDSCFKDGGVDSPHYHEIQQVNNEIMAELTRVAGYSDRKPIETGLSWSSEFLLSGMYANGRNIWRLTPNWDVVSKEAFQVAGTTDPTFRVEGQTITFPGGKIIEDSTISIVGSYGFWIETPADVTPIITNDADRYDKYPALYIDFEAAAEGKFDYNSAVPANAWGFTWKKFGDIKGESTVVTVDGNKKLSIIGSSDNWLVDLPNNVTAGDTYAEDQAWQLTVTIPEGMNAESEIKILYYTGNKQSVDDTGFTVKGGKLYYCENGEEKEMMAISAGTYTFKREMNFNDEKAFYSTYTVYDASGAELKKVEDVAVPTFNYISKIGFAVATDKAVLVDNFKLSVIGTALDFSVYDAKTGQDAELGATRDRSTAYRLSWMNATTKAESATLKADIYEGGALKETKTIKSIDMQPGSDGIVTGIVELAEGQSVKVYLESSIEKPGVTTTPGGSTEQPTDPSTPAETTPAGNTKKDDEGGVNIALIAVIAAVVVVGVAIVLALTLTKKPAAKPEAKAEEKTEEKPEE